MTYARTLTHRSFLASFYAVTRQSGLLRLELLLLEIGCVDAWLARLP